MISTKSTEKHRSALKLLKKEAIQAHLEGDGLKVNLLCETGCEAIAILIKRAEFDLSLQEISWIFIFQGYWLLDHHTGHLGFELFKKIPLKDNEDNDLAKIIDCYWFLIERPDSGWSPAFMKLSSLNFSILNSNFLGDPPQEYAEILVHFAELAWYRTAGSEQWGQFLDWFQQRCPLWALDLIKSTRSRLEWQTRLVIPNLQYPRVEEAEINELRKCSDLAELWLLSLYGRAIELDECVKRISATLPRDSDLRRIILDVWHLNRFKHADQKKKPLEENYLRSEEETKNLVSAPFIPKSDHQSTDESQQVWLARRRQLSASLPFFQFHERRGFEIEEDISILYRKRAETNASERINVLRLSMLHELAALRAWDRGMWRDATKAQSAVYLDSTLWEKEPQQYAIPGIILGVHALSLNPAKADVSTRNAIRCLEFASKEQLANLTSQLMDTYPQEKYLVAQLIEEIPDLFPDELWEALAEWTVTASREMDEHRSLGEKVGFAYFWWKLFPQLDPNSTIWNILLVEAEKMARTIFCWEGRHANFLHTWMKHAPLDLALNIGKIILKTPLKEDQRIFSLYRSELLIDAEESRKELNFAFTKSLPSPAPSHEERLILSRHLNQDQRTVEEIALAKVKEKLMGRFDKMVPTEGAQRFKIQGERLATAQIKAWTFSDMDLLEKAIQTINNPNILGKFLPELLNTIQLLVAFGPPQFLQRVRTEVPKWIANLPCGVPQEEGFRGPFASFNVKEAGLEDIREQLAWIVFQFVKNEGYEAADLLEPLVEKALMEHWNEPTGILCRSLIVMASKAPMEQIPQTVSQVRWLLEILRARVDKSEGVVDEDLARPLGFFVGLLGASHAELIDWSTPGGETTLTALRGIFEKVLPPLSLSTSVTVRLNLAKILSNLKKRRELSPFLLQVLNALKSDNRARVRMITTH